jgi:molecular chaperone GrpE
MDMLRKRGVTPIEAVGTTFDPQVHQAVAYEEAANRRDGEVIEQFTRGYRLGDKLIRAAMVKVAKA